MDNPSQIITFVTNIIKTYKRLSRDPIRELLVQIADREVEAALTALNDAMYAVDEKAVYQRVITLLYNPYIQYLKEASSHSGLKGWTTDLLDKVFYERKKQRLNICQSGFIVAIIGCIINIYLEELGQARQWAERAREMLSLWSKWRKIVELEAEHDAITELKSHFISIGPVAENNQRVAAKIEGVSRYYSAKREKLIEDAQHQFEEFVKNL